MQSRAGMMQRRFYGTRLRLSSAFWLTQRKTLQIHCTTVCTIKIHPQYFKGWVLIQKRKKYQTLHWLNGLNAASSKEGTVFFVRISKKMRNLVNSLCVLEPFQSRHNSKPGSTLWCFHDQGHPTRQVLGSVLPLCLPWCRWEEKASEEFLRRTLTL